MYIKCKYAGAFHIFSLGGIGLTNTQYARLIVVGGQYDLGLGIVMGAHQVTSYTLLLMLDQYVPKYFKALWCGLLAMQVAFN